MSLSSRLVEVPIAEAPLVLALATVDGFAAACADHGDRATLSTLIAYYAAIAAPVKTSGGRVVKTMGDGVLLSFPATLAQAGVAVLREVQQAGTGLWQAFDPRCRVSIRATAGTVLVGAFGPPGDERDDVFGDALNRLFKASPGPCVLSPEIEALLR